MTWRLLPTLEQCETRLRELYPREAFDTVLSNPLAAWSVAAMIYVDAIVPADGPLPDDATWARPMTVLWLSEAVYARGDSVSRSSWRAAEARGQRAVQQLLSEWGLSFAPRYSTNTREGLRDETWPRWAEEGAARLRPGVKVTSSVGRWALTDAFADLFEPQLEGDALTAAIDAFRDTHMSPSGKVKALTTRQRAQREHAVAVTLPDGTVRQLEPGEASTILRGVIEHWAPARLADPSVLTISQPGDKIYTADSAVIQQLGLSIDQGRLLPDALLVDVGSSPPTFWIVEVVATDGPIDEERKRALEAWATKQRIPLTSLQFLTAFGSRNARPAKLRLKDLAAGTYAWYLDEPELELAWYEIES